MPIEVVFFDVGGPIYGDRPYYEALLRAVREARPDADEEAYWEEFEACRRDQSGSFTRRLTSMFVEPDRVEAVIARGQELWEYPPATLQADVAAVLPVLHERYRLGILANQEPWIRDTLARDGLEAYFELWAVSGELGIEKPDPGIFRYALEQAGVEPGRCAMVGDRLDNDIVPARALGLRTVWLLRGEAPDDPSAAQLAEADASIRGLDQLSDVLERLDRG